MNGYMVVVSEQISRNGDFVARISQVQVQETERWRIRSARCHIQLAQGFGRPRLGSALAYLLGVRHPLIITRSGDRVTICEVEIDGIVMVSQADQVEIPVGRVQAIHEAVLAGLDGKLGSASIQ